MRIGELADASGVSTRALRYYEQRGLLQADRQENGYRAYDESAVTRVRNIRALLDAGLKADNIRRLTACLDEENIDRIPTCMEAYALYERRLQVVRAQLAALTEVESRLEQKLADLRNNPHPTRTDPTT